MTKLTKYYKYFPKVSHILQFYSIRDFLIFFSHTSIHTYTPTPEIKVGGRDTEPCVSPTLLTVAVSDHQIDPIVKLVIVVKG